MTIRKATIQDKDQILKLVKEFDDYFAKNNLFSEEVKPFTEYKDKDALFIKVIEDWLDNSKYFVFVAEENEQIVGHIVGEVVEKSDRVMDKEGSIDEWFVTEDYRHHGVGRELYDALVDVFKQQKCNHIGLKVYSANKETIDMYRKIGFKDLELTMVKPID